MGAGGAAGEVAGPGLNRQILALAVPALGALIAEPLFLLADSAIVGHLGVAELAGLALASTVLLTAVGLSIFLAYGTTAAVARRVGAGDAAGALRHGIDGLWLGFGLGAAMIAVLGPLAPWWIGLLGGSGPPAALDARVTYLRWSTLGLPAMLVVSHWWCGVRPAWPCARRCGGSPGPGRQGCRSCCGR